VFPTVVFMKQARGRAFRLGRTRFVKSPLSHPTHPPINPPSHPTQPNPTQLTTVQCNPLDAARSVWLEGRFRGPAQAGGLVGGAAARRGGGQGGKFTMNYSCECLRLR
jgi:hypothetical protein